jgi:predicted HTH domain antitoxin
MCHLRLSSGRAAELAGLPRVEFLLSLSRYKVFPLSAELDELEREHGLSH